jgi:group I intron endonuclease
MICGIYKITSANGRIYIGQSINIKQRFKKYFKLHCKQQLRLHSSLLKYGVENHTFEIIEECEQLKLNERERFWQDFYNCINGGLNLKLTHTDGKSGAASEITKLRMSHARLGEKNPNYGKKCYWAGVTGKKHPRFGLKGKDSPRSKKVIDTKSNFIYHSVQEAAEAIKINPDTLQKMLVGRNPNKTNFKYL